MIFYCKLKVPVIFLFAVVNVVNDSAINGTFFIKSFAIHFHTSRSSPMGEGPSYVRPARQAGDRGEPVPSHESTDFLRRDKPRRSHGLDLSSIAKIRRILQ